MEDRFRIQVVGQELGKDDVNLLGSEASLADDRVLAELLRLTPQPGAASPARGILPASSQRGAGPVDSPVSAVVVPSGSADARTIINPFRAVIGPRSTAVAKDAYRDIRSAISIGQASDSRQYVTHTAQPTNPRWDIIYAVVDVETDGTFLNRYVKTDSTPAVAQSISTTSVTRVQLAVTQGTPGATPVRPTIPADSGPTYYIPLAFVLLPAGHTLTSSIPATNIQECAPVLSISRAMGVGSMVPATGMSSASGIALTEETWTPATGRPKAFLPSTMTGAETVIVALKEDASPRTIALGATKSIDNSRDWRRRLFRVTALADTGAFSWTNGNNFPDSITSLSGATMGHAAANSFNNVSFGGIGSLIFSFTSTFGSGAIVAAGATASIYVDNTTGELKCAIGATAPACNFLLWIEATGQFNNAF